MSARKREFDVVVVGARCAGATLAAFLARRGKRVLLVDMAKMPSDQPMSTHFIGPHGMSILDELGVGDRVRAIAPPICVLRNGIEDAIAQFDFPRDRSASCIRRIDLDPLLVDEARASGATIELRTKLVNVVREGERVVGVLVEHDGVDEEIRASVVVGADGRHSTLASLVSAEEYGAYDSPRAAFWGYWRRPEWFEHDPNYRGGACLVHFDHDYVIVFPVNRDQLLVGVVVPIERAREWNGRRLDVYLEHLRKHAFTARIAAETRTVEGALIGRVVSFVKGRFFFRRAAGPGWALVGDAGLFKDFAPGLGITDAFRDAKALATAIDAGTDSALEAYWRDRDVQSIELFAFAQELGMPGYNNALNRAVFRLIAKRPDLQANVVDVHDRRRSPFAIVPMGDLLRIAASEILRGRFDIVAPLLAAGKRVGAVRKELELRKTLAAALPTTLAREPPLLGSL